MTVEELANKRYGGEFVFIPQIVLNQYNSIIKV